MALKGTLKDFGIADIFQLIGQQGKTGILHLTERESEVHVSFKDGCVVRTESATRKRKELIGDMLLRAGYITEEQLSTALEEQKRTLKRLGDLLVTKGIIEVEALKQMAHLQTTETLYRLFSWKNGRYEFEAAGVEVDANNITPIPSDSVLMEAFRRIDEWPLIRRRISHDGLTFERVAPLPSALDNGFGAESDSSVGANETAVYQLAEPDQTVRAIIDRSRLGEFEACKALLNLLVGGYLAVSEGAAQGSSSSAFSWRAWVVPVASRLAVGLLLVGLVATWIAQIEALIAQASPNAAIPVQMGRAQVSRIETAVAEYEVRKGALPRALEDLVELGILRAEELRYPWREAYHYERLEGGGYRLLPPLE